MSDNHDFILFDRQMEAVDIMTDAQVGQLIKAMYHHNHGDEVTFEDPMVQMAFVMFWQAVEASRAKREKLRDNGSKGGKAKSQKEQSVANGSKDVANSSKELASSSKDVANDSLLIGIGIDIDKNIKRETTKEKSEPFSDETDESVKDDYPSDFEEFWRIYPRKKNKKSAFNAWTKLKKTKRLPSLALLAVAIERANRTEDWQREGGRFIPHPASWLNAEGWNDEVETEPAYVKPDWI